MKVAQWAEIRRLSKVEGLSGREIARRLHCCTRTVKKALASEQAPGETPPPGRGSILDPYKAKIDALIAKYPRLVGSPCLGGDPQRPRRLLPVKSPWSAITCDRFGRHAGVSIKRCTTSRARRCKWTGATADRSGSATRRGRVSVFVAVLCYSRLVLHRVLASRNARPSSTGLVVHALEFFGGSPRQIIFDNLKAAVLNGRGRHACLHPEFLALCGHFCLEPIACARRDPESKGIVEAERALRQTQCLAGPRAKN